jgi:hypothetical protein
MRRHPRYEAFIECQVLNREGVARTAIVANLSVGGAGVRIDAWDGDPRIELRFRWRDQDIRLSGEVVHSEPVWSVTLNIAFSPLTPAQYFSLRQVLDDLRESEERRYDIDGDLVSSLRHWLERLRGRRVTGPRIA